MLKTGKIISNMEKISLLLILWIFIFRVSGQEIKNYYPAQVYMTLADNTQIKYVWEVGYGFDNINDFVYFNIRPNDTEEFSFVHKIYNIIDSFDINQRLISSDYYLDDHATISIHITYDDPEMPDRISSYTIGFIKILPYTINRSDIKMIEIYFSHIFSE